MSSEKKPAKVKKERKIQPVKYFKDVLAELKKLTWPTKKELISLTGAVFAFLIAMAVMIGIMDFLFNAGIEGLTGIIKG
ncbi:MAG: preprotein translocase subunit SecE [Clostridiales bacterium]|jgi:preprotein translocase subunit SecE|nr:preprotein translocase subunit SecE [Clostridiales bacterium]